MGSRARGPIAARGPLRWLWPAATAASLCAAVGALFIRVPAANVAQRRATFIDLALPTGVRPGDQGEISLSRDGRRIAFFGINNQGGQLWVLDLDSGSTRPLSGAGNGRPVAWSPDGRRIVFAQERALKSVEVSTEVATALATAPKGGGWGVPSGTWNQAGDLIIAWWALLQLGPAGGDLKVVALPDAGRGEVLFLAPQFLPDGQHYLFSVVGLTPEKSGVYLGTLGSSVRRLILPSISRALPLRAIYCSAEGRPSSRRDSTRAGLSPGGTGEPPGGCARYQRRAVEPLGGDRYAAAHDRRDRASPIHMVRPRRPRVGPGRRTEGCLEFRFVSRRDPPHLFGPVSGQPLADERHLSAHCDPPDRG